LAFQNFCKNLKGLVLLTQDAKLTSSPTGITKEFAALCQRSTEYHFPSFENQVESMRHEHLGAALTFREEFKYKKILFFSKFLYSALISLI